jgi:WS/DGAT/MGAT family acyltransferase
MSRLSSSDAFWMNAEPDGAPFAIGALVVLDGPAPSLDELRRLVTGRLVHAERMRQRLQTHPLGLRHPEWVPADPDLAHHVREVSLDGPGDEAEVEQAVSEILATPMDYGRPLWDLTMLTGLGRGSWAIVSRLHHTVADGHGALMLTGRLIDADPAGTTSLTEALDAMITARATARPPEPAGSPDGQARTSSPDPGEDQGAASTSALVLAAARRGGDLILRALRTAPAAAEAMQRPAGAVAAQLPGTAGVLAGDPGQDRTWTTTTVTMSDVKRIRAALGGTVNDVVMALMSGGYRALLGDLGIDPDQQAIRVLVPVSLRSPGDLAANNQISGLLVTLPLAGTAEQRHADLRAHLDAVKGLGVASLAAPVLDAIDRGVPAFVQTLAVRSFTGQVGAAFAETLVTNVPGPPFPIYVAGRRARSVAPTIPLGGPWRLVTGVVSYDGVLHFGITGGQGIGDRVHLVAAGVQDTLAELTALAEAAPPPSTTPTPPQRPPPNPDRTRPGPWTGAAPPTSAPRLDPGVVGVDLEREVPPA